MKKRLPLLIAILFSAVLFPLAAQVSVDPSDSFYTDALRWNLKHLVASLPQIRPYPMATVKSILVQVLDNEKSEEDDIVLAQDYYERFFGEQWIHVSVNVGGRTKTQFVDSPVLEESTSPDESGNTVVTYTETGETKSDAEFHKQYYVAPSLIGDKLMLGDWASAGIDVGLFATSVYDDTELLPFGINSDFDSVDDASSVRSICSWTRT